MACLSPSILSLPPPQRLEDPNSSQKPIEEWLFCSLKSPKTLPQLKTLHAHIYKTGLTGNDLVSGQLLLCCSLSNSIHYARQIFDAIPRPKPFFYNAMIKGYSETGAHHEALRLYSIMRARSVPCDSFTFPVVLRSASSLARIDVGEELHGLITKTAFDSRVIVRTALIDMYCACGLSDCGRLVFDRTSDRDVICWNTMIAGYVKCGEFSRAKQLFDGMPEKNISSWNTLIDMYCKCGDIDTAHRLFDEMPGRDLISWNSILSGYSKVGQCEAARRLFDEMPQRNVVSWNVVITCYVHNRLFTEALELFRMMQLSDIKPNEVTVVAVLPACAHLGALDNGQWIHAYICRLQIKMDIYVNTALIDMYGKCGGLEDAQRVFDEANKKDTFLCSTMIEVMAMHGKAEEAFRVFTYMTSTGIKPSDVTFVGLLKACSHAGLVDFGRKYFEMMTAEFGLTPKMEHFGCMVDLLGRAGFLEEAHELVKSMPMEPHPVVWATLLSSCRIHGKVKLAEQVALRLIELVPQSGETYVLLSNIYSQAGRWNEAANLRKMMKEKGVIKKPGCSSIEVNNDVYEFFAGDRDHPHCKEIYEMLEQMASRLNTEGYVPQTSSALHDVNLDEKEQALLYHSEKLAVAFGLLSTQHRTPIRIVKNLRVCDDCHLFMKVVSKYYKRTIIARDCNRFHHFSDGSCSCSDFW
ncbi:pentatricopeptide repeat-containing protein At3g62890-like [Macadamia integrifolia]|uniref:pentatricopeptide repeat-containing protein At3g62890-like n=1 Tax=Macadamia integrifolia TaxID=60698 RepID=UPI001C4F730F|nr:pentatricopeptide repeat-containing protein At3g62890-like [Macadamia integrifolia]